MALNDKSSVTKEQNDRHRKILEGLMKLPENRECADCRSKGPRWASVNLGVFLCIQCSGIHRSLGVHISKVRSATLDTWLPEQVTFMQGMGNAKANAFWEAEIPSMFRRPNENDHGGLESFIRSKYEARRWIPKSDKSPAKVHDERHTSVDRPRRSVDDGKHVKSSRNFGKSDVKGHDASEGSQLCTRDNEGEHLEASRGSQSSTEHVVAVSSALSSSEPSQSKEFARHPLVLPAPKPPQNPLHSVQGTTVSKGPKIEAPTDLFDLLNTEELPKTEDSSGILPSSDDQGWAAFQSAESFIVAEDVDQVASNGSEPSALTSTSESSTKTDIIAELEDLFKGSPAVSLGSSDVPRPQKEVRKEDILTLFGKTSMASPYAAHQQNMAALLAQRQSMLMAAAKVSGVKTPVVAAGSQQTLDSSTAFGNLNTGSSWPAGNSVVAGLVNNSGSQGAGSHFGQIGGATYHHQAPVVQASVSNSSVSGAAHGTISPFQSLVSSSLTALGASGLAANGSPYQTKNIALSGTNELYSNGFGQSNLSKPSTAVALDTSSVSAGSTYDFSALTAAALSKH